MAAHTWRASRWPSPAPSTTWVGAGLGQQSGWMQAWGNSVGGGRPGATAWVDAGLGQQPGWVWLPTRSLSRGGSSRQGWVGHRRLYSGYEPGSLGWAAGRQQQPGCDRPGWIGAACVGVGVPEEAAG
ncbi:hypothetical protein HaLaN_21665 [Haematococcus lacustris]|uniref:Uncharacterized protein n=1 Tax=Haematococcus lacustris TaxID=44745 RepID=A0A699ZS21_HAELA|nr:hypothetical protein HaLaN_21665 [Haematococcus lacustris]